jgi:hypothetical protein
VSEASMPESGPETGGCGLLWEQQPGSSRRVFSVFVASHGTIEVPPDRVVMLQGCQQRDRHKDAVRLELERADPHPEQAQQTSECGRDPHVPGALNFLANAARSE